MRLLKDQLTSKDNLSVARYIRCMKSAASNSALMLDCSYLHITPASHPPTPARQEPLNSTMCTRLLIIWNMFDCFVIRPLSYVEMNRTAPWPMQGVRFRRQTEYFLALYATRCAGCCCFFRKIPFRCAWLAHTIILVWCSARIHL